MDMEQLEINKPAYGCAQPKGCRPALSGTGGPERGIFNMRKSYYFPHDYNARTNPKLLKVLMGMGVAGIGIYWCVVEQLYEQDGRMPLDGIGTIAFQLHVEEDQVQDLVRNYGLFENDGTDFWSEGVNERIAKMQDKSLKRSKAGILGNEKRWGRTETLAGEDAQSKEAAPTVADVTDSVANATNCDCKKSQIEIKGNKMKEKETVEEPAGGLSNAECVNITVLWNKVCTGLPKVVKVTRERREKIALRLKEFKGVTTPEELFKRVASSPFLNGKSGGREWRANFDWLFANPTNWVKVLEGNYDDGPVNGSNHGDLGPGERIANGRRTYGDGQIEVPMDAPKRPSNAHQWTPKGWLLVS